MEDRLRVGIVSSVHGIHGECKVFPTTDDMNRFKKLKKVYADDRELELEGVKFFKNMVIVKFKGIDTPEDIQKLRNKDLMINREDAVPLEEGEYFINDLIGCDVIDEEGKKVGECKEIFPTGANQVMEVDTGKKTFPVPYIKQCILDVDLANREIKVHLLDGLMEL